MGLHESLPSPCWEFGCPDLANVLYIIHVCNVTVVSGKYCFYVVVYYRCLLQPFCHLLQWSLSLGWQGCVIDAPISFLFSANWWVVRLCVSTIFCKRSFSDEALRETLIYGHKDKIFILYLLHNFVGIHSFR